MNMTNHPLIVGVLLTLFGASIGFNSSQLLVVGDVKLQASQIQSIEKQSEQDRANMKAQAYQDREKEAADITNMTLLFSKTLDSERELIELVKVQNELLGRKK